jgi:hypothetical protein
MTARQPEVSANGKRWRLVLAVALLGVAAACLFWSWSAGRPIRPGPPLLRFYAYDPKTGELNAVAATGAEVADKFIVAHVFSSGNCGDLRETKVGYLERLDPEAAKLLGELRSNRAKFLEPKNAHILVEGRNRIATEGLKVSRPETPDDWVTDSSPEGVTIKAEARAVREGRPVTECFP